MVNISNDEENKDNNILEKRSINDNLKIDSENKISKSNIDLNKYKIEIDENIKDNDMNTNIDKIIDNGINNINEIINKENNNINSNFNKKEEIEDEINNSDKDKTENININQEIININKESENNINNLITEESKKSDNSSYDSLSVSSKKSNKSTSKKIRGFNFRNKINIKKYIDNKSELNSSSSSYQDN